MIVVVDRFTTPKSTTVKELGDSQQNAESTDIQELYMFIFILLSSLFCVATTYIEPVVLAT